VVVLKRAGLAGVPWAAPREPYAQIVGCDTNNDGFTEKGITFPSGDAQSELGTKVRALAAHAARMPEPSARIAWCKDLAHVMTGNRLRKQRYSMQTLTQSSSTKRLVHTLFAASTLRAVPALLGHQNEQRPCQCRASAWAHGRKCAALVAAAAPGRPRAGAAPTRSGAPRRCARRPAWSGRRWCTSRRTAPARWSATRRSWARSTACTARAPAGPRTRRCSSAASSPTWATARAAPASPVRARPAHGTQLPAA
jgi:hypothetical protein